MARMAKATIVDKPKTKFVFVDDKKPKKTNPKQFFFVDD